MKKRLWIIVALACVCCSCSVIQTMREKHYNIVTAKRAYHMQPLNEIEVTRRAMYKTVINKKYIPQTELEKATYAMKDTISDYRCLIRYNYFESHWCNIHDYKGKKLLISEHDSLPECFYIPIFAAILYSPRSTDAEDTFSKETGWMLMYDPSRMNEIITLASQMRHDLKYWILTEVIGYYIRQFNKATMFMSGIKYTDLPLYEYIEDDEFLKDFFAIRGKECGLGFPPNYRAYKDIKIDKQFLDSLYLCIPHELMSINPRFF